jgi:hypothetical protein
MTSTADAMIDNTLLTGLFASIHSPDACTKSPIRNFIPGWRKDKHECR